MMLKSCTGIGLRASLPVDVRFVEEIAEIAERVQLPVYSMVVVSGRLVNRHLSTADRVCLCS